jgi:hypothetical protein
VERLKAERNRHAELKARYQERVLQDPVEALTAVDAELRVQGGHVSARAAGRGAEAGK